ncbi:enoyl-CoA hydratase/isomerase family protein [uncultured Ramlibacter sp.]|uniref:enoyl-CoA hydratase/isomerase family protein n=1 Tax=uncultured Ramlibacter sp. TaxID=260755 RepID=UPI002639F020|nr:enoyl-CoA hydratase/isomerase family protein [uncultured Ramlibacter sp.]
MSATNDEAAVHLKVEGAFASIVFDRPQARNAMTWSMYQQLGGACEQLKANSAVRVVTLRGAGGAAFVAGTDIAQFKDFTGGEDGVAYERQIDAAIALLESLPMATVAVIEGWCVGGGLAIATACDIRIATPDAKLGVPIARTLGNCLSIANLARLVAAFGRGRVQRMLVGAEVLEAAEGLACGYLAQVLPAQALDAAVQERCKQLASLAPVTQAVTKEALSRLVAHQLPEAEDLIRRAYGSEDFREGVQAFNAKRKPVWRNR